MIWLCAFLWWAVGYGLTLLVLWRRLGHLVVLDLVVCVLFAIIGPIALSFLFEPSKSKWLNKRVF